MSSTSDEAEFPPEEFFDRDNHDVHVVLGERLFTFPFNRDKAAEGGVPWDQPHEISFDEKGARRAQEAVGLGLPPVGGVSVGPAISAISRKPDPGSAHGTCYVINTNNLRLRTPWTAAEWSEEEGDALEPRWGKNRMEALLAGPQGRVVHVAVRWDDAGTCKANAQLVPLAQNPEIWFQLRNGLIAGRVGYPPAADGGKAQTIPLVNVTSLTPDSEDGPGGQP